jgi:sporulation protein YhbH
MAMRDQKPGDGEPRRQATQMPALLASNETVFRPYRQSSADHSDRSAGDRLRHRQKVRQSIRDNIADIIAEESIIGRDRDRIIKVPIRGVREYRFVFGPNEPGVAQGDGEVKPGDVVGKTPSEGSGPGRAGDQPGVDYYETDVSVEELIDIMFEDLELPDLERKKLRQVPAERANRRKGYRQVGARVRLDKHRTVKAKLARRLASGREREEASEALQRFPFHESDLTYRHKTEELKPESNAVVICIMDTSGSMDNLKKYLARSFFFLLYRFVLSKYRSVEIVFVAHHTEAQEVSESEFFHKGESGGTLISSGYRKALDLIAARYHPSLWNIYAFHCSDGDNFDSDNDAALDAAQKLAQVCNLFGYGEIKPGGASAYESSMMRLFQRLPAENFLAVLIERRDQIWPCFKSFLSKDRAKDS